MINLLLRLSAIILLTSTIFACASPQALMQLSELQQGKRYFQDGYYKRAMHQLLPLACDGNPEAQYAVGYMYYYGYGVAQDTDVGYFWIKRSANHHFPPAEKALSLMAKEGNPSRPGQAEYPTSEGENQHDLYS